DLSKVGRMGAGHWRRAAESIMRGISARPGLNRGLFLAFALTAGLSLAACSDIDSMFGGESQDVAAEAPPTAEGAGAPPPSAAAAPVATQPQTAGGAPVATITPVNIDAGPDTGTAVNKTVQALRNQVM